MAGGEGEDVAVDDENHGQYLVVDLEVEVLLDEISKSHILDMISIETVHAGITNHPKSLQYMHQVVKM